MRKEIVANQRLSSDNATQVVRVINHIASLMALKNGDDYSGILTAVARTNEAVDGNAELDSYTTAGIAVDKPTFVTAVDAFLNAIIGNDWQDEIGNHMDPYGIFEMSREALKELIKAYKETDRARRFTLDTLKVDPQLTEQQLLTTFRSLLPEDIQKETKKHFSTWSKKDVTIAAYQQYLTSSLPKTGVTQPFTCYAGGQVQRQQQPVRGRLTPHAQAQQQWQRDQA